MPSSQSRLTPRCQKLNETIIDLRRKLASLRRKNKRAEEYKRNFSSRNVVGKLLSTKSKFVNTFVNMQLFHGKKMAWTHREKHLAISMYLKSPSTYRFLLRDFGFVLPGIRTIQYWQRESSVPTGVGKLEEEEEYMTDLEEPCEIDVSCKSKQEINKHLYQDEAVKIEEGAEQIIKIERPSVDLMDEIKQEFIDDVDQVEGMEDLGQL